MIKELVYRKINLFYKFLLNSDFLVRYFFDCIRIQNHKIIILSENTLPIS